MSTLGTQAWLDDYRERANASDEFGDAIADWHWPVGLAFLGEGDEPTRYAFVDVAEGECAGARSVDRDAYEEAPIRLAAPYSRWHRVLEGDLDPIRAILLRKIRLEGDLPTVVRHHAAATALIRCACEVEASRQGD